MSLELDSATSSPTGLFSTAEIAARLNSATVQAMTEIVSENVRRTAQQSLAKGVFYPRDYYDLLSQSSDPSAPARLKWFKDRDYFYHSYLSHKHFEMLPAEKCREAGSYSNYVKQSFLLKAGVAPSAAITAAKEGISAVGCGEVCQIAQYAALLSVLGPKTDSLFAAASKTRLIIDTYFCVNPLNLLRCRIAKENPDPSEIGLGDQVYIYNASSYSSKNPMGLCTGYNAICTNVTTESKRFAALGLPAAGLTHAEIEADLFEECNVKPIFPLHQYTVPTAQKLSQVVADAKPFEDKILSFEEFQAEGGGKMVLLYKWNVERVTELVNASTVQKARALFTKYNEERLNSRFI